LQESDARPLHLCPVCLRKLQWSIEFDVVKHYEHLHQFCQRAGFEDEAAWIARRLKELREDGYK
jgi:archaemetzincin